MPETLTDSTSVFTLTWTRFDGCTTGGLPKAMQVHMEDQPGDPTERIPDDILSIIWDLELLPRADLDQLSADRPDMAAKRGVIRVDGAVTGEYRIEVAQ